MHVAAAQLGAKFGTPFPNFFDVADKATAQKNQPGTSLVSGSTVLFADERNGLVFQSVPGFQDGSDPACASTINTNRYSTALDPLRAPSQWAAYSSSGTLVADRCGLPAVDIGTATGNASEQGGLPNAAVADSTDHLVMVPRSHPVAFAAGPSSVSVISETTLEQVADICIDPIAADYAVNPTEAVSCQPPSPAASDLTAGGAFPQPHIVSVSWYAPADDLIVLTDNRMNSSNVCCSQYQPPSHGPLVVVSELHIQIGSGGGVSLVPRWSYAISNTTCTAGIFNGPVASVAAVRSDTPRDNAVFIPCQFDPDPEPNDGTTLQQFVVVKVALGATCASSGGTFPCPGTSPQVDVATAPVPIAGFLFDPVSERGFLPVSTHVGTSSGVPVLVYEGATTPAFTMHIVVGKANELSYSLDWALDSARGRFYAFDLATDGYGLTIIDTRRTPLGIGSQLSNIHPSLGGLGVQIPVMPSDASHPAPWVPLPWFTNVSGSGQVVGTQISPVTVVEDAIPVTVDPPVTEVDSGNTDNSAPPAGATVYRTFSGGAGGYAAHVTLVGGYGAPIRDMEDAGGSFFSQVQQNDPAGDLAANDKQASLFMANVEQLSLADGSANGNASALTDGNGDATHSYEQCTNASALPNCQPPHCPVSLFQTVSVDACYTAYQGSNAGSLAFPENTSQQWPAPSASCSNPGPSDGQTSTQIGLYYTPARSASATADPTPSPVPGTGASPDGQHINNGPNDAGTRAHVDCVQDSGVEGDAWTPKLTTDFGLATVEVGSGMSVASVLPPAGALGSPIQSTVTSEIRNLTINLGSGPGGGQLRLGLVQQDASAFAGGRNGTAGTTHTAVIGDLDYTDSQGAQHQFCMGGGSEFAAQGGGCSIGSATLQQALAQINQVAPTRFAILAPQPSAPFGIQIDGAPKGSPGGYTAQIAASPAEQSGDQQFNGMTSAQASYLPALRIVIYQDSARQVAREVVDLAGVEADTQQGVQFENGSTTDSSPSAPVSTTDAAGAAGLPSTDLRTIVQNHGGGTGTNYVPTATGPLAVIQRVLAGLDWLRRSPGEAAEMAGLMALFGMPLVFIARRRSWMVTFMGEDR